MRGHTIPSIIAASGRANKPKVEHLQQNYCNRLGLRAQFMDQVFVVKMQRIVVIPVRQNVKIVNLLNLATVLHYHKIGFSTNRCMFIL